MSGIRLACWRYWAKMAQPLLCDISQNVGETEMGMTVGRAVLCSCDHPCSSKQLISVYLQHSQRLDQHVFPWKRIWVVLLSLQHKPVSTMSFHSIINLKKKNIMNHTHTHTYGYLESLQYLSSIDYKRNNQPQNYSVLKINLWLDCFYLS